MIDSAKLSRWYDFQAPFYRLWRDDYDGRLVRAVEELCGPAKDGLRLLDAGTGTGCFSIGVGARNPGWRIEALDASPGMLKVASAQAAKRGLTNIAWRCGDVTSLPYTGESFDIVIAAGLFPNLNDGDAALREFRRTLEDDGRLLVVEFDRTSMTRTRRIFFRAMILGYKMFAAVMPRFRFADVWNIQTSTIDRQAFESQVAAAGFRIASTRLLDDHLVYELSKGAHP